MLPASVTSMRYSYTLRRSRPRKGKAPDERIVRASEVEPIGIELTTSCTMKGSPYWLQPQALIVWRRAASPGTPERWRRTDLIYRAGARQGKPGPRRVRGGAESGWPGSGVPGASGAPGAPRGFPRAAPGGDRLGPRAAEHLQPGDARILCSTPRAGVKRPEGITRRGRPRGADADPDRVCRADGQRLHVAGEQIEGDDHRDDRDDGRRGLTGERSWRWPRPFEDRRR